jgi:hypothetical protein
MAVLRGPVVFLKSARHPSSVVDTGRIIDKRLKTIGRVVIGSIVFQRLGAGGGVLIAGCEAEKPLSTKGGVVGTGGKAKESSTSTFGRVSPRIASIRCRSNRSRCGRKPKTGEHERDDKQSVP